ncbi:MAG: undecaprenyl-diphosphate phosphatase, partial [Patescibacteria group bacterium]|nr:undecaprenyl-diphosphate phosphatase [Patescibacteria group bacterium]
LGLLFEDSFKTFFAAAQYAAGFLILNGIMLYCGELLRRKRMKDISKDSDTRMSKMSWMQAAGVGFTQAIALFPGFSRTGATLAGGLLVGLSHEDAVRYSFLLATPVIGAAALLKIPELFTTTENAVLPQTLFGAMLAGISAYFSVKFLVKYFKTNTLTPFAIYCFGVGILTSILFLLR